MPRLCKRPIGIGIIGCGGIARYKHIPDLAPVREMRLVACSDLILERAEAIGELGGATFCTDDNNALLARQDVDAVIVATPHPSHAKLAIDVLRAQKHVLVQKPMATTLADANRLLAIARRSRKVAMSLPYHFDPWTVKIEQMIRRGDLGDVRMARCRMSHDADHGRHIWFAQKKAAHGGAIFDMGVYAAALLVQWLGRVVEVSAAMPHPTDGVDVEQGAAMTLQFSSGAVGVLETSWQEIGHRHQAAIYGREGTVQGCQTWPLKHFLEFARKPARQGRLAHFKPLTLPKRLPMPSNVCQHWADCILGAAEPIIPIARGRHLVEIMCAGYESAATHRHVRVHSTP